jgi:hypothetical protein
MNDTKTDDDGADAGSFWRRLLHRWLVQYNPLYLLSATLVLGGMILTSRGLAHEGSVYGEVGVAAIAELYAVALIGGAALLTRIGQRRPAVMLALLTALYQGDLTLHTETCAYLGSVGTWAAAAWLALFVAKLYALAWALKLELSRSAVLLASLGALGLAVLPQVLDRMDARGASAVIALWSFALASLYPSQRVTSRGPLDPWGQTVLRRSIRAAWLMWGVLLGLHVLFWSTQHRLELEALVPVLPLLATRRIRNEARVWCGVVATLVIVALRSPELFAVSALVAAAALCLRALSGVLVRSGDTPVEGSRHTTLQSPYRAFNAETTSAAVAPPPSMFGAPSDVQSIAVGDRAKLRLLVGAGFALYLSVWTHGWTSGPWPAHVVALDLLMVTAVLLVVWRARVRFPLAPLAAASVHFIVQVRLIPAPRSLLQWGTAAMGLGFASLMIALATSYWLRNARPVPHGERPIGGRPPRIR